MAVREGENSRGSTKCLEHFGPPKAPEGAGTWMCLRQSRPNTMTEGYPKPSLVLGFLCMAVREGESRRLALALSIYVLMPFCLFFFASPIYV